MCDEKQKSLKDLAKNREDFMKRWFAIAISVGFATALSNMPWLKSGVGLSRDLPVDWDQVRQCFRLAAAAIATILSWDGYFQSISNKPLTDSPRFFIDIGLVFLYLFLLLTSKFDYFWLWIHATAFLIYIVWDRLSIGLHRSAYVNPGHGNYEPSISEVYRGCFTGDERIYPGPAITIMWPLYFWSLPITHHFFLPDDIRDRALTTLIYATLVITGLFAYRYDKKVRLDIITRMMMIIGGVIVVLLLSVILRECGQNIARWC